MNYLEILKKINEIVWGPQLLLLLMGVGLYLTVSLRLLQVRKLGLAFKYMFRKNEDEEGDVSSYAALCTALASTIGTGNIVGVATAIAMGGPGALFWMWIAAFLGMATKYAEGFLAIKYREVDDNGQMSGGPMFYIKNGLNKKWHWLAYLFAGFAVFASIFGLGNMTQVNGINEAVKATFNIPEWITVSVLFVLSGVIIIGGIKTISKTAEIVVPFMALFYIAGALIILITNYTEIPRAFGEIFKYAFTTHAKVGGFAGASVMLAMRSGISRGVFSNESGLGSAPIAAAAAKTDSPVEQGLVSMLGTLIDTIIVCTLTGLTIVVMGTWHVDGVDNVAITSHAFANGFPIESVGAMIVNIGLIFFAFTTIIGWSYYGERCIEFLGGVKMILPYRIVYILVILIPAFDIKLKAIWALADIANGLMAFPNLIALALLSGVIVKETKEYFENQVD